MWMFIIIYFVFLVLEGVSEIIKMRKGKRDVFGTIIMTIFGFSFIASAINSDFCSSEDALKIAFAYSILYAIYWITVQVFKMYYVKTNANQLNKENDKLDER